MSEPTTHKELMTAMGSKNGDWDPTAPEWYMRLLESSDPVEQAMGWMQYTTVRYPIRKPYATGPMDQPLNLQDLGAFFHWTARKTQRTWRKMEARGYVKKSEGKLWLRADFKVKHPIVREDGPVVETAVDPVKQWLDGLPDYQREAAGRLPRDEQLHIIANLAIISRWTNQSHAQLMGALREEAEQKKFLVYRAGGIPVKTLPKRRGPQLQMDLFPPLELELPQPISAVLNPNGSGESGGAKSTTPTPSAARTADPHTPPQEGRHADTSASPACDRVSQAAPPTPDIAHVRTIAADPPAAQSTTPAMDWDAVGRAAAEYIIAVDDKWVAATVALCLEFTPDLSPREIGQLVHLKGKVAKSGRNPAGLLQAAVVNACHGQSFEAMRQRWRQAEEQEREQAARQHARQTAMEVEMEATERAEKIWESLTPADKSQRITMALPEVQKRLKPGYQMPADMLQRNAADLARAQFIREYLARVSQGEVGITEVA